MESTEVCTEACVGFVVGRKAGEEFLLIEQRRYPFWMSLPSQHKDPRTDSVAAAKQALKEILGVDVADSALKMVYNDRHDNNPCQIGENTHEWTVFYVALADDCKLEKNVDVAKSMKWVSRLELAELERKTLNRNAGGSHKNPWEESQGLEPIWIRILRTAHYL